jgi:hypothetical protein
MDRGAAAARAGLALLFLTSSFPAGAQGRRRFEPTDLRLQPAGNAEVDLQGGPVTGEDGTRAFVPDFETSLGIGTHAELELDGTFGLDGFLDPVFLDNTLLAMRVAMFDQPDEPGSLSAWSGGIQAGARLPTLPGRHGLGFEGLAILGRSAGKMHVFFQGGTILDPFEPVPGVARLGRPFGIEGGVNLDLDLGERDVWSLTGEIGAIKYLSPQRDQLHLAAGPQRRITSWLEVSLVGLVGLLPGGDRLGLFLGADTTFKAF